MNFLKKILNLFGSKISERDNFRIDTSQIENLAIKVNERTFQLNDISLEGLSFIKENEIPQFQIKQKTSGILYFKEKNITIDLIIKRIEPNRVSCQVLSPLDQYKKFLTDNLIYIIPMQY